MTDDQRFRLDENLRAAYEQARADLSRFRQVAAEHGKQLEHLGAGLGAMPEKVNVWREDDGPWRWVFAPRGAGLAERELPEWSEIRNIADEIRRRTSDVERLGHDMRERKLL